MISCPPSRGDGHACSLSHDGNGFWAAPVCKHTRGRRLSIRHKQRRVSLGFKHTPACKHTPNKVQSPGRMPTRQRSGGGYGHLPHHPRTVKHPPAMRPPLLVRVSIRTPVTGIPGWLVAHVAVGLAPQSGATSGVRYS